MAGSIRSVGKIPAFLFTLLICACLAHPSSAQRRLSSGSPLDTLGKNPSQEEGWEILKTFRSLGWDGGYNWRIQLKIMPRRERTRYVNGLMYGDRNESGPISRIDVIESPADVNADGEVTEAVILRLLLQSGKGAYAMRKRSGEAGPPEVVDSAVSLERIAGSEFSLFDLMAPYIHWPRFRYEGRTTFRGSPTHLFWMHPPEGDTALTDRISGVRLYINDTFKYLAQTEIFGVDGKKMKTLYILGLEKVDEQTIFKEMDVRNEITRDKTRLKIVDARMGLELPASLFTAQSLLENLQDLTIPVSRQETFAPVN